jgi:hypothetical protein
MRARSFLTNVVGYIGQMLVGLTLLYDWWVQKGIEDTPEEPGIDMEVVGPGKVNRHSHVSLTNVSPSLTISYGTTNRN